MNGWQVNTFFSTLFVGSGLLRETNQNAVTDRRMVMPVCATKPYFLFRPLRAMKSELKYREET